MRHGYRSTAARRNRIISGAFRRLLESNSHRDHHYRQAALIAFVFADLGEMKNVSIT